MSTPNQAPSLFKSRLAYKPFDFPFAYQAFVDSESMHWLATEVPLNDDVKDWNTRLNESELNLLTQIFRFFTQADIDVAGAYIDRYLPLFKPIEIRMAMTSIAAREAVHIQAYSMLIDEIGIPETEYSAFLDYQEMREKHEYLYQERDGDEGMARDIAVFSAFGEGLQLFASFVMLLNFTRFGKMKGMGQIVAWSIRDESHHVEFMMKVFHQFINEKPHVWTDAFKKTIYDTARDMVALEDRFIDLVFGNGAFEGGIEGLTADDVKQYIRFIADRRLLQLGLKPNYGIAKNPLPWVDVIVNGKEHVNFFENRATDYSKGAVTGSWDEAFADNEDGEDAFDFGGAFDMPEPADSIAVLTPPTRSYENGMVQGFHEPIDGTAPSMPEFVVGQRPTIDVGGGVRVPVSMGFKSGTPNPNTPITEVTIGNFAEVERYGLGADDLAEIAADALASVDKDHWVIFTKVEWEKCPYCVKAKKLFAEVGIAYEQKSLDPATMDPAALAEFRATYKTVPQIWRNGVHVGGYNELVKELAKDDIDPQG